MIRTIPDTTKQSLVGWFIFFFFFKFLLELPQNLRSITLNRNGWRKQKKIGILHTAVPVYGSSSKTSRLSIIAAMEESAGPQPRARQQEFPELLTLLRDYTLTEQIERGRSMSSSAITWHNNFHLLQQENFYLTRTTTSDHKWPPIVFSLNLNTWSISIRLLIENTKTHIKK